MRSKKELIAHHSVIELHKWIEEVFTGRAGYISAFKMLLNSFSTSFVMITMQGKVIDSSGLERLFHHNIGSRPQLRIEIDDCKTVLESESKVACRYRETHYDGDVIKSRWSLVVIDVFHEKPRWCYLHETSIEDQ